MRMFFPVATGWRQIAETEEERRVLYVGMTRACHTLSIFNRMDRCNPFVEELVGSSFVFRRESTDRVSRKETAAHDYVLLGLDDVFLIMPGNRR